MGVQGLSGQLNGRTVVEFKQGVGEAFEKEVFREEDPVGRGGGTIAKSQHNGPSKRRSRKGRKKREGGNPLASVRRRGIP